MIVYIPFWYDDDNYDVSWTGNYRYKVASIRGIFDTKEQAEEAVKGWRYEDDCEILERWIELPTDESGETEYIPNEWLDEEGRLCFNIEYTGYLNVWQSASGNYALNEIVDETYSDVFDPEGHLGVDDY